MATGTTSVTLFDAGIVHLHLTSAPARGDAVGRDLNDPNHNNNNNNSNSNTGSNLNSRKVSPRHHQQQQQQDAQQQQQLQHLNRHSNKPAPFGSGTVVASLAAHEGSLLHFVALAHCSIPLLQQHQQQLKQQGGENQNRSSSSSASPRPLNQQQQQQQQRARSPTQRNQLPATSASLGHHLFAAHSAAALSSATTTSTLVGKKQRFYSNTDSHDVPLFASTRGVYAHAQKSGRVYLAVNDEDGTNNAAAAASGAYSTASSSLQQPQHHQHYQQAASSFLGSSPSSYLYGPRFADLDLVFCVCDVTEQSLPICGFVPSRVLKVDVHTHQHHYQQQHNLENSHNSNANNNNNRRSPRESEAATTAGTTSSITVETVRRAWVEPARWFATSLKLVVAPPASKQSDGSSFYSGTFSSSASFRHPSPNANAAAENATAAADNNTNTNTNNRRGGGRNNNNTNAGSSPSPKPAGGRGGASSPGGGGDAASPGGATTVAGGTTAAGNSSPQAIAMSLVRAVAELDSQDNGHFSDEALVEHWIVSNAVKLPDGDFRKLTASNDDGANHAIAFNESFPFNNASAIENKSSHLSVPRPFLLGGDLARRITSLAPIFVQLQNELKQFNNRRGGKLFSSTDAPLLFFTLQLESKQQQPGSSGTAIVPLLLKRKVQEFISAVDVFLASLSSTGFFAGGFGAAAGRAGRPRASSAQQKVEETEALPSASASLLMARRRSSVGSSLLQQQLSELAAQQQQQQKEKEQQQQLAQSKRGKSGIGLHREDSTGNEAAASGGGSGIKDSFSTATNQAHRRVCPSIELLPAPPTRVEFINLFLDRFVIDEILNARKIFNSDKFAYEASLTLVPGANSSTGSTAAVSQAQAQAAAAAAATSSGNNENSNNNRRRRSSVGRAGAGGRRGSRSGGHNNSSSSQHDVDDFAPVNSTTSQQRTLFIADIRSLQERESLLLATAPQFLTLFDVVSLSQHVAEHGFFPALVSATSGTSSSSKSNATAVPSIFHLVDRVQIPSPSNKPGVGGAAAAGGGGGANNPANRAGGAAARGGVPSPGVVGGGGRQQGGDGGPFAGHRIKRKVKLLETATVSSYTVANFILHVNERLHAARCAVVARRFALLGQAGAQPLHHSQQNPSLGSIFSFSSAAFKSSGSATSATATPGPTFTGGNSSSYNNVTGGGGTSSGSQNPNCNAMGMKYASPGERSEFTLCVASGSTIAKVIFYVRELPLALRSSHRALAKQVAIAKRKFQLAAEQQQQQQNQALGSNIINNPTNTTNTRGGASPSAGAAQQQQQQLTGHSAVVAAQIATSLSEAILLLDAVDEQKQRDQQLRENHWASSFVIEDIASVTVFGKEAEIVKHLLDLPNKQGWSFTQDYRIPVQVETTAATDAFKSDLVKQRLEMMTNRKMMNQSGNINNSNFMPTFAEMTRVCPGEYPLADLLTAELQDRIDCVAETQRAKLLTTAAVADAEAQQQQALANRRRRSGSLSFVGEQQQHNQHSNQHHDDDTMHNANSLMNLISGLKSSGGDGGNVVNTNPFLRSTSPGGAGAAASPTNKAAIAAAAQAAATAEQTLQGVHSLVGFRWKWDDQKVQITSSSSNMLASKNNNDDANESSGSEEDAGENDNDADKISVAGSEQARAASAHVVPLQAVTTFSSTASPSEGNFSGGASTEGSMRMEGFEGNADVMVFPHSTAAAAPPRIIDMFPPDQTMQQEIFSDTLKKISNAVSAAMGVKTKEQQLQEMLLSQQQQREQQQQHVDHSMFTSSAGDPFEKSSASLPPPDSARSAHSDNSSSATTSGVNQPQQPQQADATVGISLTSFSAASALIRAKRQKKLQQQQQQQHQEKEGAAAMPTAASSVAFQYEFEWEL